MSCLLHLLSTAFDTLPICLLKISTDNSIASISSAFGWFILFRRCFMISSSHSRDDLHHAAHEPCRAIHGHTPIWFALLSLFVELFHLLLVLGPKLSEAVVLESIDGLTPPVAIVVAAVVASADDITTSVAEGWVTLPESIGN
mmetsp:Transcript_24759/g.40149  ORF Transcript_24759/g.40149 Transcript_24759/m.40149 type:complete len:143 (-) Transcript_24759:199-627(-)